MSRSSLKLDKAWWDRRRPDALARSAGPFAAALADHARAGTALRRKPDPAARERFESSIAAIEAAAGAVVAEAKALLRKSPGDDGLEDAIRLMGRPLTRELQAARATLAELGEDEDDGPDSDFTSAAGHQAYLKATFRRLKRSPYSFAFAMPSNDPADSRFIFHRKRGGRALGQRLRKIVGARKFTFGVAGAEGASERLGGEEGAKSRTLVLLLEGRVIPGLAKRAMRTLRKLGVRQFNKVKVIRDGETLDDADAADVDKWVIEPVDLEADDDGDGGDGGSGISRGGKETAVNEAAALKRRFAGVVRAIRHTPKARHGPLARRARAILRLIARDDLSRARRQLADLARAVRLLDRRQAAAAEPDSGEPPADAGRAGR